MNKSSCEVSGLVLTSVGRYYRPEAVALSSCRLTLLSWMVCNWSTPLSRLTTYPLCVVLLFHKLRRDRQRLAVFRDCDLNVISRAVPGDLAVACGNFGCAHLHWRRKIHRL